MLIMKFSSERQSNPIQDANIISFLTFFYTLGLFKKGVKKDLEECDIYEPCEKHNSRKLGEEIEIIWNKLPKSKSSVYQLLSKCYARQYLFLGVILLFMQAITLYVVPASTKKLVTYFVPNQNVQSKPNPFTAFGIIIGMSIINAIFNNVYFLYLTQFGIKIRAGVSSLIYRKALKIPPSNKHRETAGKIVSLLTKDVIALESFVLYGNYLWIAPIELGIAGYILFKEFGAATTVPMSFIVVMLVILVFLGKLTTIVRIKSSKRTDQRLQLIQETLTAIRTIKTHAWEIIFKDKIFELRRKEIHKLFLIMLLRPLQLLVGMLTHEISVFLQLLACSWFAQDLSAAKVYFALSAYSIVRYSVNILGPRSVIFTSNFIAANRRISDFLNAEEIVLHPRSIQTTNPKVEIKEFLTTLDGEESYQSININLVQGLYIVSGAQGSGKSTFLESIFQDYAKFSCSIVAEGKLSYASQEAWLFPGSIRDNIVFGESYNRARYRKVLEICALKADLMDLPAGDWTVVEDNGRNLSKGQQARINLARAIYSSSDIYLLDEFLCSLDYKVRNHIFKCIKDFFKDKICLIVSNDYVHIQQGESEIKLKDGRTISVLNHSADTTVPYQTLWDDNKSLYSYNDNNNDQNKDIGEKVNIEKEYIDTERESLLHEPNTLYHERKQSGSVGWRIYHKFAQLGGGYTFILAIVCVSIICLLTQLISHKLMKEWADIESKLRAIELSGNTSSSTYIAASVRRDRTIKHIEYCLIGMVVLFPIKQLCHTVFTTFVVSKVHKQMISRVLKAPMTFFDNNFIGNILNRFSKDLATMEDDIPPTLFKLKNFFFETIAQIVLIVYVSPFLLLPVLLLWLALWILLKFYLPTGRSLRRLEAATRAPVIGHLNASLEGVTTIRARQKESMVYNQFCTYQDVHISVYYMSRTVLYAFTMAVDILGAVFVAIIIGYFLATNSGASAGGVGLAITKAFLLTKMLLFFVQEAAEIENQMTSVERALEYTVIEQEPSPPLAVKGWSNEEGSISFEHVSLFYPKTLRKVLKDFNFSIKSHEKIGIVGRTGAGKSSVLSSILRLYETEGKIIINNIDVTQLDLAFLRSNIAVVPQDPFIFTGTIRDNVDPEGIYSDAQIWSALEIVGLKSFVQDLQCFISSRSLSGGQSQLLCLVRAILKDSSIIILDEIMANLDSKSADVVQNIIANNFKDSTVIVVTHKISSILNFDKVILVGNGMVTAFDSPLGLVNDKRSEFYRLIRADQ